jgi:hypothetical protein
LRSEQPPLADSDYDSILCAVMETARGRWFLHEYVRRNRNADTGTLLAAIERIESLLKTREDAPAPAAPIVDTPPGVSAILVQLRDIAENLIECGAPTYLCNDLLRRIEDLALAYSKPAASSAPIDTKPAAVVPVAEIVEPPRDPFADILALSPEERIALFT